MPLAGGTPDIAPIDATRRALKTLSTYADLVARAAELRRAGDGFAAIAETLNREGWRPAKRRETFNAPMVHHLLIRAGAIQPRYRRHKPPLERRPDEWTIRELAERIGMPEPTLYTWVQRGRLCSRMAQTATGRAKLVHADPAAIAALKAIRTTPAPWRRLPPPLTQPENPAVDS